MADLLSWKSTLRPYHTIGTGRRARVPMDSIFRPSTPGPVETVTKAFIARFRKQVNILFLKEKMHHLSWLLDLFNNMFCKKLIFGQFK